MLTVDENLITYKDFSRETLLHIAVKNERKDIVQLLLRKGVDIDEINRYNQTAF